MGKIIPFASANARLIHDRKADTDHKDSNQSTRAEELKSRILSRINRMQWTNVSDRIQIAKNLWDILHAPEVAAAGKRPADILVDSKKSHAGDSTKRLNLFAIPSHLPNDEAERRSSHLRKGVHHFVDLARTASEASGLPSDHFLLQLFSGTSYFDPTSIADDNVPPHLVFLADTFQQAGEWIARRHNLKGFFETWPSRPKGRDLLGEAVLHIDGFQGNPFDIRDRFISYCGDGLTLPSLFLFSATFGQPVNGRLEIDAEPIVRPLRTDLVSDPCGDIPPLNWQHDIIYPLPASKGGGSVVKMQLFREIWLTLAPIGIGGRIIPCFDMRTRTQLSNESGEILDLACPYWNDSPRMYIRSGNTLHTSWFVPDQDTLLINRSSFSQPFEPYSPKTSIEEYSRLDGMTGAYFYYERVDHLSCQKFLGANISESWSVNPNFLLDSMPVICPFGTIGAILEVALLAGDEPSRLDSIWEGVVRCYVEAHEEFTRKQRETAEERLEALRKKWNTIEEV